MLILHVVIALTSVLFAGYTSFSPTVVKVRIMYGFIIATIGTGTYLTYIMPAHMVASCIEGIVYLAFVTSALIYAKYRIGIEKRVIE